MLAATSPWQFGWDALVAIGTLLLALVTAVLAAFTLKAVRESRDAIKLQAREVRAVELQTASFTEQTRAVKEQAEATQQQVSLSLASMEDATRPVLVGVVPELGWRPSGEEALNKVVPIEFLDGHFAQTWPDAVYFDKTDTMIYGSVPLRNVGAGVAFVQRVELVTSRDAIAPLNGRVTNPIVRRDETTRTLFAAVRKQSDGRVSDWEEIVGIPGRGYAQFTIRVVCSGASAELVTVTELTASEIPGGSFIYTAQKVWSGEGDNQKLLVSTDNIAI